MKISPLMLSVLLCLLTLAGQVFALEKVNINTADAATLERVLTNVGPAKAQAIVEYRTANGSFRSPEQLAMVKGIGLKTVEKNRDRIVVNTPRKVVRSATLGADASAGATYVPPARVARR